MTASKSVIRYSLHGEKPHFFSVEYGFLVDRGFLKCYYLMAESFTYGMRA